MIQKLSRRAILRGAGGAALGLPLLELTAGRANAGVTSPKRLIIVSVGHSVDVRKGVDSWTPQGDWARLSPVLEPLIPHRDKLLLVNGVDNMLMKPMLVPTLGHDYCARTLLTCMPTKPALDAAGNLIPNPPACGPSTPAGGPSIEFVLANAWKEEVLNLRVGEGSGSHKRSYRMDGTLDDGIPNPMVAFDRLFRGRTGGPMLTTPAEQLRAKRPSVLDAVGGNFRQVLAKVGAEDRRRLDRHSQHIREFEMGLQRTVRTVCENPQLQLARPLPTVESAFTQPEGRSDDVIAAAQIELIVAAMACQATRVAHLHFSTFNGNTFPWLNGGRDLVSEGWHGIVHIAGGTDDQRLRGMQWYMKVFGDLLTRLEGTPELGGSLLDNTMVLWISNLKMHFHSIDSLPIIIAGNLGGKIRTGRTVSYSTTRTGPGTLGGGASLGDLYTTILNYMDVPATSFGWNKGAGEYGRKYNNGPLAGWGA